MGNRGQVPPPLRLKHPPYELPADPDNLEQKLSAQHSQLQKLLSDNRTLTGSVDMLRRELAAKKQELKAVKLQRENQTKALVRKIATMEANLLGAETVKSELEKGRTDVRSLSVEKKELTSKAQKLTLDIRRAQEEAHILPSLISKLKGLRYEYEQTRAVYDYEKKLSNGQLESVQGMENNFISMTREFENLHPELKSLSQKGLADGQCSVVAQKLTQDSQRDHILPKLNSGPEGLRRDYEHIGATYIYGEKLYYHHLESTWETGKKRVDLAREVEKLEAELRNTASAEKQPGYNEKEVSEQDSTGQGLTEDSDGVTQKPSGNARRKKFKRQCQREIKRATMDILPFSEDKADAQHLDTERQDLNKLTQDLQSCHSDGYILPATPMPELKSLKHEHKHIRPAYNYDNIFYNGPLESIKLKEKESVKLAREFKMFEAEVNNIASARKRAGPSGGMGYNERDVSVQDSAGQETRKDNDNVQKNISSSTRLEYAKRKRQRESKKAEKVVFPLSSKTCSRDC